MEPQFIRIQSRIINLSAISYVRVNDELDVVEIRLLGPSKDVTLTIEVKGEEAAIVREFFLKSGIMKDLRPEVHVKVSDAV